MDLDIREIYQGLPGLTETSGKHLYEACIVCLARHNHSSEKTRFKIIGDKEVNFLLKWDDIFNEQLDRTWADQFYATEHGAVCLIILLSLKLTKYTVIEKSARKNGFDYWLGDKGDLLFQKKARLEISGIFNGNIAKVNIRYRQKKAQTNISDESLIPAIIGIVEFSNPIGNFSTKK